MNYEIKFAHGEDNIFVASDKNYTVSDMVLVKVDKCKMIGRVIRELSESLATEGVIIGLATSLDLEL